MAEKIVASDLGIIIQLMVFITILLIAGFGYGYLLSRFLKVKKKKGISFLYNSECVMELFHWEWPLLIFLV
jgi:predicted Na+-dependent transporter